MTLAPPSTTILLVLYAALPLMEVQDVDAAQAPSSPVAAGFVVNQVGYLPGWSQSAAAIGLAPDATVFLEGSDGRVMYAWRHPASLRDPDSGKDVTRLSLPALNPGHYRLVAQGLPDTRFLVAPDVLSNVQRSLLRAYYLQRCGVALDDPETGLKHPADHLADGVLAHPDAFHPGAGIRIAATGGWHDAGDFGKYVATTAVTTGRLLSLYLDAPQRFSVRQTGIPESGNGVPDGVPDILNEARIGLDWMLAMQREDGALYRKLSGAHWPDPIPPDQDDQPRYVYGVSSADTAKAAAAFALASRAWAQLDPALAVRYRGAATRAWQWLQTVHARQYIDAYPGDDSGSGPYVWSEIDSEASLRTDVDDRVWAAAELWLSTGDQQYLRYVERHPEWTGSIAIFEWKNPASLGLLHLLDAQGKHAVSRALRIRIGRALQDAAARAYQTALDSGFQLANRRFVWGSNKMDAEEGILLAEAARHGGNSRFLNAAIAQLDFLLGVNPFGKSFVSSIGAQAVQNPAHLWGRAVGRTIPGLLVGGPNDAAQDGVAPGGKKLLSYTDDDRAYSVNEFAIDYNASLLGLIGALALSGFVDTAE